MEKEPEITAEKEREHSFNLRWFILWLFVILLLYLLSIGPVMRLVTKGIISKNNKFVELFYQPLERAYDRKPFHKPLGMYLHLWAPERFDAAGDLK